MHLRIPILLAALALLSGCTLSTVRSAEVYPGLSLSAQGSAMSPPGEDAYWFWAYDCYGCNGWVPGLYAEMTLGKVSADGARGREFSAGFDAFSPFVGAYTQLAKSERSAYGIGGRLGLPLVSWSTSQVYGRYDRILRPGQRLLLNPAVLLHWGNSPNGENRGHFVGVVQGVGIEEEGDRASFIPAVSVGLLSGKRAIDGLPENSFTTAFATASITVVLHRKRAPAAPVPVQPAEP
ncbi:MAG TPA: hypothetical protein VGB24_08270 [Longimicrobium sp.]|jgi:hypothetical protein|uniref:hypothetical protein n=1 Tax=Longimicrobium sp. TaxID=2029185 RepID=UPI002EDA6DC2